MIKELREAIDILVAKIVSDITSGVEFDVSFRMIEGSVPELVTVLDEDVFINYKGNNCLMDLLIFEDGCTKSSEVILLVAIRLGRDSLGKEETIYLETLIESQVIIGNKEVNLLDMTSKEIDREVNKLPLSLIGLDSSIDQQDFYLERDMQLW